MFLFTGSYTFNGYTVARFLTRDRSRGYWRLQTPSGVTVGHYAGLQDAVDASKRVAEVLEHAGKGSAAA